MRESSSTFRVFFAVLFTVLIAAFLSLLPVPDWLIWLKPRWVVLVAIFWAMILPNRFGVVSAWLIGLLMDFAQGTILGEQAIALAIITYITIKMHARILHFTPAQKILTVFILIVVYQLLMFVMQMIFAKATFSWFYWLTPFTSILFWPLVYGILKGLQRRLKILDTQNRNLIFGRE